MEEKNIVFSKKIFDFDDRLIRFAGECIYFTRNIDNSFGNDHHKEQIICSTTYASLYFEESKDINNDSDFIFKLTEVVKELKEARNSLKILQYIKEGNEEIRHLILKEIDELIAIASKMIINRK